MRDIGLLGLRLTIGGYLAAHGAQKLFGALEGPGLETTAAGFDHLGLQPGRAMAALAGGSEFVGGLLTATGLAHPVGPVAIAGAMTVASTVHGDKGPMLAKGGYELPVTNLAAALALAAMGPGRYSLDRLAGRTLPRWLANISTAGAVALTAYSAVAVIRTRRGRPADTGTSNAPTGDAPTSDAATGPTGSGGAGTTHDGAPDEPAQAAAGA